MTRRFLTTLLLAGLMLLAWPASAKENPVVRIETNQGVIRAELYPDKAPITVRNFLQYANDGFYDGTIFHRVIRNFMIQGGGFTATYEKKATRPAIENEADNGLQNVVGTLAMARTSDPHSATAQFFINTHDNGFLDHREKTQAGWGYTVFGKVVEGLDVVRKIEAQPAGPGGPFAKDAPKTPMVIQKVTVETPATKAAPEKPKAK